jgi:hypothetical protein
MTSRACHNRRKSETIQAVVSVRLITQSDDGYEDVEGTVEAMGIRVLIIEDEAEIADFLVRGLREEGFAVRHEAEGCAGWSALTSGE